MTDHSEFPHEEETRPRNAEQRLQDAFKTQPRDTRSESVDDYARVNAGRQLGRVYVEAARDGIGVTQALQRRIVKLNNMIGKRFELQTSLEAARELLKGDKRAYQAAEDEVTTILGSKYFGDAEHGEARVTHLQNALAKEAKREPGKENPALTLSNDEDAAVTELYRGAQSGQEREQRNFAAALHFGYQDLKQLDAQIGHIDHEGKKLSAELDVLSYQRDVVGLLADKCSSFSDEIRARVLSSTVDPQNRPHEVGDVLARAGEFVEPEDAAMFKSYIAALAELEKVGRPDVKATLAALHGEREHATAEQYADELIKGATEPVARADRSLDRDPNK